MKKIENLSNKGKREHKMDRNEVRSMTFEEADDHVTYWNNKSKEERLNAACFIIHQIFGTTPEDKLDLHFIDKRKHPTG